MSWDISVSSEVHVTPTNFHSSTSTGKTTVSWQLSHVEYMPIHD